MTTYAEFLARKALRDPFTGIREPGDMPAALFPHQRDIVRWALRRGRAAIFAGTGLGKTLMELVWAQRVASPIWTDINPSDTLQYRAAREQNDERHIAPLQLEVIRRCCELWSRPGDVVLTPFGGIGSEVYVAVEMGRKGIGIELKPSYFHQAVRNLEAIQRNKADDLFAASEPQCA